jgi:hypothetical protein
MNIPPVKFYGLLDSLADQFFKTNSALCVADDFGGQLVAEAKKFFSIAIINEALPENIAVLGVLSDDSGYKKAKNSFTFVIYIDVSKINGKTLKVLFSLILAHEICHFAFYYELFLTLGATVTPSAFDNFRHTVSGTLAGAITKEKDSTRKTLIDEHNVSELIYSFGKYPNTHFAKKSNTELDYRDLFFHFLDHLNFGNELAKLRLS